MKSVFAAIPISLALLACTPKAAPDSEASAMQPDPPAALPAIDASTRAPAADASDASPLDPATGSAGAPDTTVDAGHKAVNDSIDATLGDHTTYQAVITSLQKAVAAGDASAVAELADYPISVQIDGKDVSLKEKQAFIARYQDFMTPDITKAIVDTKYSDLFVNAKGVMFGDGQAWINGICRDDACKVFDVKLVTLQPGA